MKPIEKYLPVLQKILDQYEKDHPHWQIEVLVSILKRSLLSLKHCLEDVRDPEISWRHPFVELHYPIGWNWKKKGVDGAIAPGGLIFGRITSRNTATKELVHKTLFQIMDNQLNATVLANATNWAWYEKSKNFYTPRLPVRLAAELYAIEDEQKRREHFHELVRPFSFGAARIDFNATKSKSGTRVPKRARKQLAEINRKMDVPPITISGEVNGKKFQAWLAFEIHPMIADYDRRKAYHSIVVGLGFSARMEGNEIIEDSPAGWPQADQEEFWKELIENIDRLPGLFIQKEEKSQSVILSINSKLKIPAAWWRPENRSATMKLFADVHGQVGEIVEFSVGQPDKIQETSGKPACKICGWIHDAGFTRINVGSRKIHLLGGVLSKIVAAIHRAHENGQKGLGTKDDELKKICRGYQNPCKAFEDKNHREDYKALFYTRAKGIISLRGALGIETE